MHGSALNAQDDVNTANYISIQSECSAFADQLNQDAETTRART